MSTEIDETFNGKISGTIRISLDYYVKIEDPVSIPDLYKNYQNHIANVTPEVTLFDVDSVVDGHRRELFPL
jgi:hypothetical protein